MIHLNPKNETRGIKGAKGSIKSHGRKTLSSKAISMDSIVQDAMHLSPEYSIAPNTDQQQLPDCLTFGSTVGVTLMLAEGLIASSGLSSFLLDTKR